MLKVYTMSIAVHTLLVFSPHLVLFVFFPTFILTDSVQMLWCLILLASKNLKSFSLCVCTDWQDIHVFYVCKRLGGFSNTLPLMFVFIGNTCMNPCNLQPTDCDFDKVKSPSWKTLRGIAACSEVSTFYRVFVPFYKYIYYYVLLSV